MYKAGLSVVAGLLAVAALVLSPDTAAAQRRAGAWRGGTWDGGWYGGYGYRGYWPGSYGYGYSPYYGGGWSSYGMSPYYSDTSGTYGSQMYGDMSSSYGYGAMAQSQENAAHIRVIVPADAKIWFGNSATQQTGGMRFFYSPPLTPGKDYSYDVKAQWKDENGKEVTRTRHVDVRANAGFTVDFNQETLREPPAPAPKR
jgi:uncharacterized protein (TIGR03000 family)